MLKRCWPIAVITFKEGVRNRALYGISLLALILLVASRLIADMIMQNVGKVVVDMALSAVSFTGILLVLFVGINLMAKDLDRRTIYMVLARPISRSQYIIGKFIGMALLLATTIAVLSAFAMLSILWNKATFPNYFERFSWSPILLSMALTLLMLLMLSALSFFFASLTSTSFVTLILTVVSLVIGQSLNDVKSLVETPQTVGIVVSPATTKIVQAAYYLLPNFSFFDIKIQAAHNLPIPGAYIAWVVLYAVVYSAIVIILASLQFRRREFP